MKKYVASAVFLLILTTLSFADAKGDYKQGHELLEANKLREALSYFESALSEEDFLLKEYALFDKSLVCLKLLDYRGAVSGFGTFLRAYPKSVLFPEAQLKYGYVLLKSKNYKMALEALKAYLKKFPDAKDAAEAGYLLGRTYEQLEDAEEAFKTFNEVDLYYPIGKYAKWSRISLRKLARKHKFPLYKAKPQALYNKAMVYWKKNDYENAAAMFYRLAREYPKDKLIGKAFWMLGLAEFETRKYGAAIRDFEKSLQYRNAKGSKLYYLGRSHGRRGRYYNAIKYMKKVLKFYPKSPYAADASYYLARYYELIDSPKAARSQYAGFIDDYPQSKYVGDAIFRLGMSYYKADLLEAANRTFNRAGGKKIKVGKELPQCLFWWGYTSEKLGKTEDAAGIYNYVAERFDHTFPAYRAKERLVNLGYAAPLSKAKVDIQAVFNEDKSEKEELVSFMESWQEKHKDLVNGGSLGERLERYEMLMELELVEYAAKEAKYIVSLTSDFKEESFQIKFAKVLHRVGEYRTPIKLTESKLRTAVLNGEAHKIPKEHWEMAYPKGFWEQVEKYSKKYGLDPYLTLAVIREESRFNPQARSHAWAMGLMQIIPRTGKAIAQQLKIRPFENRYMYRPETNIKMGTYYLSQLIKRFEGNVALALAAYNGGPVRVKRWVKEDHNNDMVNLDLDDFIANIPLRETRYYVQKVLESYFEYKRIYE